MHKKLIIEAFLRAKKKEEIKGNKAPSKNHLSKILSVFILDEMKSPFGERSLKNYYNQALKIETVDEDVNISQLNVVIGLCKYLGYENYEDYIIDQNTNDISNENDIIYHDKDGESTVVAKSKNNRLFVWFSNASALSKLKSIVFTIVIFAGITTSLIYILKDQTRWMVWQEDHYVEIKLDLQKYDINQLKAYKEERILYFRQITPDCYTDFFKEDGSENLWYGKNKDRELEYFTDLGRHPETGKTLKPITQYMINKHICD